VTSHCSSEKPKHDWTRKQLYEYARLHKVPGVRSKLKRDELLELLEVPELMEQEEETKELDDMELPAQEVHEFEFDIKFVHDESIGRAKDTGKTYWVEKNRNSTLLPKSDGAGLMVSAFASPHVGWLQYSDASWAEAIQQHPEWVAKEDKYRYSWHVFEYGKHRQGYWKTPNMIRQSDHVINMLRVMHPKARGIFFFDVSSNHAAKSRDALNAARMNVNEGGAQPLMREGWFIKNGERVTQKMHQDGVAKGLKKVLEERGLLKEGMLKADMIKVLEQQPDFKEQKPMLQEWIERRGHVCIFFPKFHPELSFIEMVWSSWKRLLRRRCDYTMEGLRKNVVQCREGHSGYTAAAAIKEYRSHRRVSANVDLQALQHS
jgi:hypothetical protein